MLSPSHPFIYIFMACYLSYAVSIPLIILLILRLWLTSVGECYLTGFIVPVKIMSNARLFHYIKITYEYSYMRAILCHEV